MANANGWGDGASNNNIDWGKGADNLIGWGSVYSVSSAGSTDIIGSVPATPLLLDTYTNASVAYSLRKLRTAYSGSAIRVRRSSDNAEQDIAFVGNDLDTASLLTFCGAGNGFVTTWYDQSTNANNSTQATAANQAQIVSSGALILDVDTSKITTTWTSDSYLLTSGINPNTRYLSISVIRRQTTSGTAIGLGNTASGGVNGQFPFRWLGTGEIRLSMPLVFTLHTLTTAGKYIATTEKNSSNLQSGYLNGSVLPNTTTDAPSSGNNLNRFGMSGTNSTTGQYQEYVYWDSEQSANRTGIETNVNTYWNAY